MSEETKQAPIQSLTRRHLVSLMSAAIGSLSLVVRSSPASAGGRSDHNQSKGPSTHSQSFDHKQSKGPFSQDQYSNRNQSKGPSFHSQSKGPSYHSQSDGPSFHKQSKGPFSHDQYSYRDQSKGPSFHSQSKGPSFHSQSNGPSYHKQSKGPFSYDQSSYRDQFKGPSNNYSIKNTSYPDKSWDCNKDYYPCFLRGTQILTPTGNVAVENIKVGDLVVTHRGRSLPVKWIGRRRFKKDPESKWPDSVFPVRVSRLALDERTPHTDLYLSPAHALYLDGVLIPVCHLINGRTIANAMPDGVEIIEYFHIELETHEVIFAEGAATETLCVNNDREEFDNFVEYERLYGKDARRAMTPYAPLVAYDGGRAELKALLRRMATPIVDVRDPIQVAYDRIARRAQECIT